MLAEGGYVLQLFIARLYCFQLTLSLFQSFFFVSDPIPDSIPDFK